MFKVLTFEHLFDLSLYYNNDLSRCDSNKMHKNKYKKI